MNEREFFRLSEGDVLECNCCDLRLRISCIEERVVRMSDKSVMVRRIYTSPIRGKGERVCRSHMFMAGVKSWLECSPGTMHEALTYITKVVDVPAGELGKTKITPASKYMKEFFWREK